MVHIPIFYINLAARPDRRAFMESQFQKLGLEAQRIEAVTPAELTAEQRDAYCNPARLYSMTERQYCCNLSHAQAWRALLESGVSTGLILEDDVILSSSLPRFLSALPIENLRFDIIRIETWPADPKRYRAADCWILPDIGLRECLSWDAGAAGYLAANEAAARLIDEPDLNVLLVDTLLFNPFGKVGRSLSVRHVDPGLCIQLMRLDANAPLSSSDLVDGVSEHRRVRNRRSLYRLARRLRGWTSYDLPKLLARLHQIGRRDVNSQNIRFQPD